MRNKLLLATFAAIVGAAGPHAQSGQAPSNYPLSPTIRATGQGVTAAYEGWFYNRDGSVSLLVGYFNRNQKQALDIPVGPNNRIEPGGPDYGQPTHFVPGRQFGVFAIKVPRDFADKQLTWTLVANGQTNTIPMHTKADWVVEPYEDAGSKNTPPILRFEPGGRPFSGPPTMLSYALTATAAAPLTLAAWASDEGPKVNVADAPRRARPAGAPAPPPPLSVTWSKYRGPGAVTFASVKPPVDKDAGGRAETTATFDTPGEYILRLQANDQSGEGGGGFQCCWTNAHVKVTVRASAITTEK